MRRATQMLFALAALATTAWSGTAAAQMPTQGATSQPVGHYDFCKSYPAECGPNVKVGIIQLTDVSWKAINEVNRSVNIGIFPRTDEEIYGVPEHWDYPTTEGDCEDYVLLKQYMLERQGYPRSALLISVVRQPNGDGHAVLTVRTNRGDLILDNLDDRVLDWTETPYRYLKRQSERDSSRWVAINDSRDMLLVGSVR